MEKNKEETKTPDIKDRLAKIISAGLSPFLLVPVFVLIITARFSQDLSRFFIYLIICFVFSTVIPFLNVLFLVRAKKITDIHVAVREERIEPFLVGILSIILGTLILWRIEAPREIVALGAVFALNGVIFFIITLYWKISMHLSILAAVLTSLAVLIHPAYAAGVILFPPLIWARIQRQRHNIYQGIFGALLAALGTFALFLAAGINP